jgi:hypothetical protein
MKQTEVAALEIQRTHLGCFVPWPHQRHQRPAPT